MQVSCPSCYNLLIKIPIKLKTENAFASTLDSSVKVLIGSLPNSIVKIFYDITCAENFADIWPDCFQILTFLKLVSRLMIKPSSI